MSFDCNGLRLEEGGEILECLTCRLMEGRDVNVLP
jgi:hypothetical protein